jgi:hypothetical protein
VVQLPHPEAAWRREAAWRQAAVRLVAHQAAAHIARQEAADPQVRVAADNREAAAGACSLRQAEEVVVPSRTTT